MAHAVSIHGNTARDEYDREVRAGWIEWTDQPTGDYFSLDVQVGGVQVTFYLNEEQRESLLQQVVKKPGRMQGRRTG